MANNYGQSQPTTGAAAFLYGADGNPINSDGAGGLKVTAGTGAGSTTVQGTAPAGGGGVGNPVFVAGQDGSAIRSLLTDATGRLLVLANTEGLKASYSAAMAVAIAASATHVFTIAGSGTKVIRVTRMGLSGTATSGAASQIQLQTLSSAPTGGTSTTATNTPHDSTNPVATAVMRGYTANPSGGGALVGALRYTQFFVSAASGSPSLLIYDFTTRNSQGIVLRGTAQVLSVNFLSATLAGGVISCDFEWTEE